MRMNPTLNAATMLSAAVATLALAGCGGPSASDAVPAASVTPTDPTAEAAQVQAEADRAALQAREDELAKREAELALAAREQELARREAELAAKERATKKVAATPKPVPAKAVAVPLAQAHGCRKAGASPGAADPHTGGHGAFDRSLVGGVDQVGQHRRSGRRAARI